MLDIVTVTCKKDQLDMIRLAKSIDKCLDGERHWVIVNDVTRNNLPFDTKNWYDLLSPLYVNNELRIIPVPFSHKNGGYMTQQLCKLWIWQLIQADYMILDSKSFFLKPCDITKDWNHIKGGCGYIGDYDKFYNGKFIKTIETYSEKLKLETNFKQLAMGVPFIFKHDVMKSADNWDDLLEFFHAEENCEPNVVPSEFLFYSILSKNPEHSASVPRHHLLMPEHSWADWEHALTAWKKPEILVGSIHRGWMSKLTQSELATVNTWLTNQGF